MICDPNVKWAKRWMQQINKWVKGNYLQHMGIVFVYLSQVSKECLHLGMNLAFILN